MDVVISQYDNTYIEALSNYNKALQQRNALLKMETEPDVTLMELWEQQMAMNGELLFAKRQAFVNELIPLFQQIYQHISGDKERVGLHYISHCQRGPLLEVIQRDRFKDRAVGYSLHGVHRDDLEFTIGDYQMKREGSQGQNKSYVIALKLAQFSFLKRTCSNTTPLLLLDDIFDKLDAQRVEAIVQLVSMIVLDRSLSRIPIVIILIKSFIVCVATIRFSLLKMENCKLKIRGEMLG